jgi:hypothetical protein
MFSPMHVTRAPSRLGLIGPLAICRVPPHICGSGNVQGRCYNYETYGTHFEYGGRQKGIRRLLASSWLAICLYLCLRWWGNFLKCSLRSFCVDQENLKIVWNQRLCQVPSGVSHRRSVYPGQDLGYQLVVLSCICVPWHVFYSRKAY